MKYSDQLATWLSELGYTHCFFVAGGNIMHLLESCSRKLTCIPVVHEVAAGVAAEYFNEVSSSGRAFALVTAGPGMTNIVTAMAGAFLESRELLILGGQVKVADLANGQIRQRGIQEIDGVSIAKPVAVKAERIDKVLDRAAFTELAESGSHGRKGPVFLEIPLDIQGTIIDPTKLNQCPFHQAHVFQQIDDAMLQRIVTRLRSATRPVLLLGGGIKRAVVTPLLNRLEALGIPLMVTWNGIDRVPQDHPLFFGRPNTWGQRSANILMQQADLLVALGTRLGLQQTGFNWQQFIPVGEVIQVECDVAELTKGHPKVAFPVCGDANRVLEYLADQEGYGPYPEWISFCNSVKDLIPVNDPLNRTREGFISPYDFCLRLSELCTSGDIVIPCSSGSANTVMMQTFQVKRGQTVFNDKGLASMGYGLSGSIGAAIAANGQRTILVEGDGGFIQNLQELGTVMVNRLNLKIFIFDDNGYASIRMTQKNYFGGNYIGCDTATGLGMPKWEQLFAAYDIPIQLCGPGFHTDPAFLQAFNATGAAAFLVHIDPEQTYFPKISSRITESGSMESNPLHRMSPDLDEVTAAKVFRYLPG